jgi:serine/threonine-protein kinase
MSSPYITATRINGHKITRTILTGHSSVVYEIYDAQQTAERVARVLYGDVITEVRKRFDTEIEYLLRLRHENILKAEATGEIEQRPFVILEKVSGRSLEHMIRPDEPLPPPVACAVALQVCRALYYLHHFELKKDGTAYRGVIVRGLKPDKVLLDSNGTVKISGLGVAAPLNASYHTYAGAHEDLLQYLAPELILGGTAGAGCDIYSLGLLLYEMLTGYKAFPAIKKECLIPDRISNNIVPLSKFDLNLPRQLQSLVQRMLLEDPARRVASIEDVQSDLQRILATMDRR